MASAERYFGQITFDGLASFSKLWSELVDRTDIDDIVLHIVATYEFSLLASDDTGKRMVTSEGLEKLIRSLHVVWQIQLLHLYSQPLTWPQEDRLCLLSPKVAVQSIQFLVQATVEYFDQHTDDPKGKTKEGKATKVEEIKVLLVSVYDSIFCALRLIWHSSFCLDKSLIESLRMALSSSKLRALHTSIRYNQLGEPDEQNLGETQHQQRENQEANITQQEKDILGFLREACEAIANFHLPQAEVDPVTKTVFSFMKGLGVGRFAGANNPHDSQIIIEVLTSIQERTTLQEYNTRPPNLVDYCQIYDAYMAIIGICVHHKARQGKANLPIDPAVERFAADALNMLISVKVPSEIEKLRFRLYGILCTCISSQRESTIPDGHSHLLHNFDEEFAETLKRRSRMQALSDPCYLDFKREVSNIMESVSGSEGLLVPLVDSTVPFAVSGCRGAHIHSLSSRRHIDSTSSSSQQRCHICTGDGANITGWREIPQLTKIQAALARLRTKLQDLVDERNKELPENRLPKIVYLPGMGTATTTATASDSLDNGEGPSTRFTYCKPYFENSTVTRTTTASGNELYENSNIQTGREMTRSVVFQSPETSHWNNTHEQSEAATITRGRMPDTPPRSNHSSQPSSPEETVEYHAHAHMKETTPTASLRSRAASYISRRLIAVSKILRFTFSIKAKPPSVFAELLTDGSKKIHPSSAMSSSGKQALLWTESCLAVFSIELEPGQTSRLAFRHKFPELKLDWERPLIAVSQEVFAAVFDNNINGAKIGVYDLSSSTRRKVIDINTYVHGIAMSPDDNLIAIATKNRYIRLIPTGDSNIIRKVQLPKISPNHKYGDIPRFQQMSFSASGTEVIIATCENTRKQISSSSSGNAEEYKDEYKLHTWMVSNIRPDQTPTATLRKFFDAPSTSAPDNQGITTALYNPSLSTACITFWTSLDDGQPLLLRNHLSSHPERIHHPHLEPRIQAAAFSPNGQMLILITAKGYVFKVDLKNGTSVCQITDENTKKPVQVAEADRPSDGVCLRVVEDKSSGGIKVVILSNDRKRSTKVLEVIKGTV